VPESGSLGSARGALSNGRPYREQLQGRQWVVSCHSEG